MDVAISGASGLIGTALSKSLAAHGHRPIALVRREKRPGTDQIHWNPATGAVDAKSLEGINAVVHLAGAGIGDKRWTSRRKRLLVDSRVDGTSLLASCCAGLGRPPTVFVSGSAVGYYGDRDDEELTENSSNGHGFLADLVAAWENATEPAINAGIRTPIVRMGVVLSPEGGALAKQLPPFKLGLGGRFGSGKQWLAWISINDAVRAIEYLLTNGVSGPINLVSPETVTNQQFTKTLGTVLKRPTRIPVPLLGPNLLFGKQLVRELILASQKVVPVALLDLGFTFQDADLHQALIRILKTPRG